MGIFGKKSRAASQHSATTLIAKGCTINGQLKLESDIQIDGFVEGELHVSKTLIISETGSVKGEVFADKVIVNGVVDGVCHANVIEILGKGCVTGTIYSDALSIEPGGKFMGNTQSAPAEQVVELAQDVQPTKAQSLKQA